MSSDEIIESLGGTFAVAKICEISPAAVSQWRKNGIPNYRMQFFRLYRPDLFKQVKRPAKSTN